MRPSRRPLSSTDLGDLEVDGVHGYFAHQPAEVAAHAASALGVGFSFSVHALDARKVPAPELARRAAAAVGVVACNADVAQHVDVPGARVRRLAHGVDLSRFVPRARPEDDDRLRVLAVGRLVEKKGFQTLVAAAARVRGPVTVRIVGAGVEQTALERAIHAPRCDAARPDRGSPVAPAPARGLRLGRRRGRALGRGQQRRPRRAAQRRPRGDGQRPSARRLRRLRPGSYRSRQPGAVLSFLPATARRWPRRWTALRAPALRAALAAAGRRHVEAHFDLAACTRRFVEHLDALHVRQSEGADV